MDASNDNDLSVLAKAVVTGDLDRVRQLIRAGHTVGWEPFPFEQTALHFAADRGRADIIAVLLDGGGASYIDSLGLGWTPLGMAARKGHGDAVRVLIASGADVDAHDAEHIGNTPLADAVQGRFPDIVDDLVSAGADPTIPGWMNLTALDRAKRRHEKGGDDTDRRILNAVLKASRKL
ncbi:MAG: ankyrin repeat domain-containing protein [Candidatus Eremiobacteraeota bacterium]|nr:ankyrin repeat domain-containing protein [Candidatus Eremiobacteraeota bacterium]